MFKRDVQLQTFEAVFGIRHQRVKHPPVVLLVVLQELDRELRELPPGAVLTGPRVIRDAQAFRDRLQVQTEVDAVVPPRVFGRRDPQRTGELRQRARAQADFARHGAEVLVPAALHALQDAAADARARRRGLDGDLQAARVRAHHSRRRAEMRAPQKQSRVAGAKAARRGALVARRGERGALREPRARVGVRGEHELRGDGVLRLPEALLQRSVGVAHQTFARAHVDRDGDGAAIHAFGHEERLRRLLSGRAPLARAVRDAPPARHDLLAAVAHRRHGSLAQVRPADVHAPTDQVREGRGACRVVRVPPVLFFAKKRQQTGIAAFVDSHDERLLLGSRAEHVHPRVLQLAAAFQSVHGREAWWTLHAELHVRKQTVKAPEALAVFWDLAGRHRLERLRSARVQPGKRSGERRRDVARSLWSVAKHHERPRFVPRNLCVREFRRRNGRDALL